MKTKIVILILVALAVCGVAFCLPKNKQTENYDYLRIHIRANSNSEQDQNVKYKVKDAVVEFLSPYFENVTSKQQATQKVKDLSAQITQKANSILRANGFNYNANIRISNEYFPARTYSNTTLEAGYYDAVIVELGSAVGDNWWCVMYPPLCFVGKKDGSVKIEFKSKIKQWFKKHF